MSDREISRTPWVSAGLSGSAGSAASRSHSTRSALCAVAEEGTDAMLGGSSSQMPRAQATERAADRFILTTACAAFHGSDNIKAQALGLQAWPSAAAARYGTKGTVGFQQRI